MKMKKRTLIFGPLLFVLLCVWGYFLMENSSFGSHPVDDIDLLLIDDKDLPTGWAFEYKLPITGEYDYGDKNMMVAYSRESEKGFARQYIYHFRNSLAADYSYYFIKKRLPLVQKNTIDYVNYKSQIAERWYLACEQPDSHTIVCDTLSRYDDFIILFSISVENDKFTPEQLISILESIDRRMAKLLEG